MSNFKIISWNVNSYNPRLNGINRIITDYSPDIILLQETRCAEIVREDYFVYHNPGTNGRNGVAILSKEPLILLPMDNWHERIIVGMVGDLFIGSVYIPNGGSKLSPINDKIKCIEYIINNKIDNLILGGDWNIAYRSKDIMNENPYCNEQITILKKLDKIYIHQEDNAYKNYYTWYDYRDINYTNGLGIDKFYFSIPMNHKITILREFMDIEKPSDHIPIMCTISI